MNWLVFGAGAIGTYIGGSLLLHGQRVLFIEQEVVAHELRQKGISLQLVGGDKQSIPTPHMAGSVEEAVQNMPFDAAIFALKAYDTSLMLNNLARYRQKLPPVICFQNGVENETKLAAVLGEQQVIAGTVTTSVARRAAGDIIVERNRGLGLDSRHPLSTQLAQAFNHSGLNTRLYSHPADMKWSKMLTNLLGNATSAILDLSPAQIFAHPGLHKLEIYQLREALNVMGALGLQVVNLPGVPVKILGFAVRFLPSQLIRPLLQRAAGSGRGAKMPSLHIDLYSGRKQTEVDALNGAVARYGKQSGVKTPVNTLLNQILTQLVNGSISRHTFAHKPQVLLDMLPNL